jgi:beta-fructofuranosidase
MFAELSSSRKSIGDVDVIFHNGVYHLFHLVLPNHDYIAHAISDNGLNWRRVNNAIFIGDPGSWDDLMLWTMHVSPDPHRDGCWRMFYTGLSRRDQGLVQRIGLATSDDLYNWTKHEVDWKDKRGEEDPDCIKAERAKVDRSTSSRIVAMQNDGSDFPLEAQSPHYESKVESPRKWVSFRDPFFYHDSQRSWLLSAARVDEGPIVRRGCVAMMEEIAPNQFESRPAIHAPMQYDDIEVPNLFRAEDDFYLLGSLREDAKIRYWHSKDPNQPWKNFADNVLLPRGNYAGRISRDDEGWLLWNFYNTNIQERTANNIMPPPKRLTREADGQLRVSSFEGILNRAYEEIDAGCLQTTANAASNEICKAEDDALTIGCEAGFQMFTFEEQADCFLLSCTLTMLEPGKCGLVARLDPESRDGYYYSLDLFKGVASCRSWSTNCEKAGDEMMQFDQLQPGYWIAERDDPVKIQLICFGSYHELSINGRIVLSLVDSAFIKGMLGFYVETAKLSVTDLKVEKLESPSQSDDHLTHGPHS